MRLAYFSPLPPAKTGIADYSEALLDGLQSRATVTVFAQAPPRGHFDPSSFDAVIYQIGNNIWHEFVYEAALAYPGIVVMHEANLHYLIADITIKRGNWSGYLRELEYHGGAEALAHGRRVQALEVGPDYRLPLNRRLLERSRGVIVHSGYMRQAIREAGFEGPVAQIHHGAWVPEINGMEYRARLGLDERTPLVGVFGFLKPYKRIAESLRAFRRLIRVHPAARMILVGEPHPDFPVRQVIASLGLEEHVRMLGFIPSEQLPGYIAACDVVLNLRYPTVGESSGTLMRALGLGRAVMVSDVGAFAELPDTACVKVPVGAAEGEEDVLFEYLNLLVAQPEVARALGRRAHQWAVTECAWPVVAQRYLDFAAAVAEGREWQDAAAAAGSLVTAAAGGDVPIARPSGAIATPAEDSPKPEPAPAVVAPQEHSDLARFILRWACHNEGARSYAETHLARFEHTLNLTPPGGGDKAVLEMGCYMQITPALRHLKGYGTVRGCHYGAAGRVEHRSVTSSDGQVFECSIDHFDAEKDRFPYGDESFDTVLCGELIEHLLTDPMHMMAEINRILKPGGHLVLTTPNITSARAVAAILTGYHPGFFPAYLKPSPDGEPTDARHNREYAPREVHQLLLDAGFEPERVETGEFRHDHHPELLWVRSLLERFLLSTESRGEDIFALGRKTGPMRERFPKWLYS